MEIESEDVAGEELMAHSAIEHAVGRVHFGGGEVEDRVLFQDRGAPVGGERHRIDSASRYLRSKLDPDQPWHADESKRRRGLHFSVQRDDSNESATLPFVIPSEAEGSAVLPWVNHDDVQTELSSRPLLYLNQRWVAQVSLLRPGFAV